jgi:hypothetical protein
MNSRKKKSKGGKCTIALTRRQILAAGLVGADDGQWPYDKTGQMHGILPPMGWVFEGSFAML